MSALLADEVYRQAVPRIKSQSFDACELAFWNSKQTLSNSLRRALPFADLRSSTAQLGWPQYPRFVEVDAHNSINIFTGISSDMGGISARLLPGWSHVLSGGCDVDGDVE